MWSDLHSAASTYSVVCCIDIQAVEFRKAVGHDKVGVLDIGAGSGLLSMMAARYTPLVDLFTDPCAD